MTAAELVQLHGAALVGRIVKTVAMGAWPGGLAVVIELSIDPSTPSTSFRVKHQDMEVHKRLDSDTIGVFEWETVELMP